MPDYNIYIRAIGGGGVANQTTPWSQRESGGGDSQTTSQSGGAPGFGGTASAIMRASAFAQNPDSIVSNGMGMIAKALPWVAAAYAVVKTGVAIADNVIEFTEIESGDFRGGNEWRNFKQILNNTFHPVSTTIQRFKTTNQWERDNKRARAQQDLLGGSVINSYTRRGV